MGLGFLMCKVGRTFPTPLSSLSRLVRAIKEIVGMKGVGIQRRCSTSKLLSLSPEAPTRRVRQPMCFQRSGKDWDTKGRQGLYICGATGDKMIN